MAIWASMGGIGLSLGLAIISAGLGANATLETLQPADVNGVIHTALSIEAVIALLGMAMRSFH
ncbi:hypothetical protein [Brevibacillus borstelensis]|uniref:hypothetical protein n=1 Tax=Brevibacillus borstelensis TaxID=45462 RepID=UPI0030C238A0